MGKFRSKLKGKAKGQRWPKGQSSSSNPKTHKYRDMAKSRFFQENLGSSGLTQEAVKKHDAMITYGHTSNKPKSEAETELTIAKEFENMSVKTAGSETENESSMTSGTHKTFQTFASDWSKCSNMTFSRLLTKFDPKNALHMEMLAVLAAVTEVIKEYRGKESKESNVEYFIALLETLKTSDLDKNLVPLISLLAMVIKSVSPGVLRRVFSDCAKTFTEILEKYGQSENNALLRSTIGCISVSLRAQSYVSWEDSSTMKVFDSILAFTLHSKPKVRKSAQHAVVSVLRGSCFMIPNEDNTKKIPKVHPASARVAEYCLSQIKPEALLSGHRTVLHTLTMLKDVLPVFSREYIKSVCEAILSLMTHNNVYIKTCCLHCLHALFSSTAPNLGGALGGQLTRALLAARPPSNDEGQVLAWTAVLEQAYCCLARLDINLCMPNLPMFVNICVTELWQSDVANINSAATNTLKVILLDCVKPAIELEDFSKHKAHIDAIFKCIGTGLDNPFNQAIRHVIMTIAVCFEIANEKVEYIMGPLLKKLNDRRESHNFHNEKEVEYATGCAIKALGPEFVLKIIPLRDDPENINLERSWLLPVLKEKIVNSNLKFFATEILDMATFCRKKSRELKQAQDIPGSHTYELLCNRFWSLLPSFCNCPRDIKVSFKALARVLGNVLKENPEFRVSVMQALRKLISCSKDNEEDRMEISGFAKNCLPILLNVYMSPVKNSTGVGQRLAALETIQVYLTICDETLREELFMNSLQQLEQSKENHFQRESILDVIRVLVLYQKSTNIAKLFDDWIFPLCETVLERPRRFKKSKKEQRMDTENGEDKKELRYKDKVRLLEMEHKKAYRILEEIFNSEESECKEFLKENYKKIRKMLMNSLNKVADSSKAARLRCIEHLINSTHFLNAESKIIKSAIAEAVICLRDINSKCRQCAYSLINSIGALLSKQEGGMDSFVGMVTAGLEAPEPRVAQCSLRALAAVLFHYSEPLGLPATQALLEKVAEKMLSNNREIVSGAMYFLKVYAKVIPTEVLAGSLPIIFNTLSSISDDCKRHSRLEIGYLLSRMIRKYGADTVQKMIPEGDVVMLKRLRNLRKMENRKKRLKGNQRDQDSESDTEPIGGTSKTLEDILKDSDSEMDYLDDEETRKPKTKARKGRNQAWIQDDPENIVDLADVSASRKITATNPEKKQGVTEAKPKQKDGGFKTAPDGGLIIADDESGDESGDEPRAAAEVHTDTDDTDTEDGTGKPSKLLKPGAKRRYEDILSMKSGRSARSRASTATVGSKYKAGGKGIHRPLGSAASVATTVGSEFKSKKAKGDVKKKGEHDPYAYLPLSRKNLNKRKKIINSKQFKGIVKSKNKSGNIKSKIK